MERLLDGRMANIPIDFRSEFTAATTHSLARIRFDAAILRDKNKRGVSDDVSRGRARLDLRGASGYE